MAKAAGRRLLAASSVTTWAVFVSLNLMAATAIYLSIRYSSLLPELPVHFTFGGRPDGFQYKSWPRVLTPFFVQAGIFGTCAAIGALLLSRKDASSAHDEPDARAAVTAVEAVMLMAATWVAFQAYAAYALVTLWSGGKATLGRGYSVAEAVCFGVTILIGIRAQWTLAKPTPLPYVAEHWRFGELYCNADHPALFVPTRNGKRWTLNFGRRAAVMLLGGILVVGILAPTLMMLLAFRLTT